MTVTLATHYGPTFLLAMAAPYILLLLWLVPLIASISLISKRAVGMTHGLFLTSVGLTVIFAVLGACLVLNDRYIDHGPAWFVLLGETALPGVLSYAYWRIARRTHGRSPNEPVTSWQRPGAVMAWCVLSWIIAASAYVWYLSGPYVIR